MNALSVSLTEQFYEWDHRLRGYDLWEYPVSLEPPFREFIPVLGSHDVTDDTRKPTFLSKLVERLTHSSSSVPVQAYPEERDLEDDAFVADLYIPESGLVEIQVALPEDIEYRPRTFEQFLQNIKGIQHPLSFELIGGYGHIFTQLCCREDDAEIVLQQFEALFPDAVVTFEQRLVEHLFDRDDKSLLAVDFGLDHECAISLTLTDHYEVDPLATVVAALGACDSDEAMILQVMLLPVQYPWGRAIMHAVTDGNGEPFLSDAPELVGLARKKTDRALFASLIRVCARSEQNARTSKLLRQLGSSLLQLNSERRQGLIPLSNEGYPDEIHVSDVLERVSHRSGMILSDAELVCFAHLPQASVRHPRLVRVAHRTKEAPRISLGHDLILGINEHRGTERTVTLSEAHRVRHTYVVGASGTGKSTLLLHMLRQDIESGHGVALLDPHGDLVDDVLRNVPEERLDDVIVFDPSDEDYPIGFNILDARSEAEKTLIASDLVGVFRRLSTSWGDQMDAILANGIIAFLEHETGGTLLSFRRFLVEKRYRQEFLRGVPDTEVRYYWEKEYELLRGRPQAPVLTRLDTFLRSKIIRNMVSQRQNKIDFAGIMEQRKIFLAKLSHGAIGEQNAHLLGTLLVTALNQAAQRRQSIDASERTAFYFYIDEFQNFVTPTMESILSGARKFNMALTLAHQDLRQLESRNRDVASSVLANPCTRICFRTGDADSVSLAKGFSAFSPEDLQSLGIGQAIARIEQAQYDFNLRVPPPDEKPFDEDIRIQRITTRSRQRYGVPRSEVEAAIREAHGVEFSEEPQPQQPSKPKSAKAARTSEEPVQPKRPEPTPRADESPTQQAGRGGSQHKYLQSLIKKLALERGFGAETESSVLGGHGAIDVLLSLNDVRIACEISVTTSAENELQNIQKCLAANIDHIVVLSHERKKLAAIQALVRSNIEAETQERIHTLLPDEFLAFLESVAANADRKTVRGYKVNVSYKTASRPEQRRRQDIVARLIVDSLRRLKNNR